jgi:hypothetical protein
MKRRLAFGCSVSAASFRLNERAAKAHCEGSGGMLERQESSLEEKTMKESEHSPLIYRAVLPKAMTDPDFAELRKRQKDIEVRVFGESYRRVKEMPFLVERWLDNGIRGSSAIFLTRHVNGWSDKRLLDFLRTDAGIAVAANTTIKRLDSHVFVNFRFQI